MKDQHPLLQKIQDKIDKEYPQGLSIGFSEAYTDTSDPLRFPPFTPNTSTLKNFLVDLIQYCRVGRGARSMMARNVATGLAVTFGSGRRSTGDLYATCKHYFPGHTYEEVVRTLVKLEQEEVLLSFFCGAICKWVWGTVRSEKGLRADGYQGFKTRETEYDALIGTSLRVLIEYLNA